MIKEIQAKTLLSRTKNPDDWFGVRYNMNLYRGCEHRCIYCDSRSECYQIENMDDVLVKVNAIDLLRRELASKRIKGTVGTGAMSDPYTYAEANLKLTRQALEVIVSHRFPVHITTKSDMIVRDVDLLSEISRVQASVCFTVTTADDSLGKKLEPGAPLVSARFRAAKILAESGVLVGITLMPVLPFIEDTVDNISQIVARAAECGVKFIVPWFGMSMRDRQRAYYYEQLDRLFPGLRQRYEATFGDRYSCACPNASLLARQLHDLRERYGIATGFAHYRPRRVEQLTLF